MTIVPHDPNAEAGVRRLIAQRARSSGELDDLRAAETARGSAARVLPLLCAGHPAAARWHAARAER